MEYTSSMEKQVVLQIKAKEMCNCPFNQSDSKVHYADQDTFENERMSH